MTVAVIRPPALRQGDLVALVAPAGPLKSAEDVQRAVLNVENLGYRATVGEHALARYGHVAGTDAQRAADFNAAVNDPDVRAIFALRGGYGTMRILHAIDYHALRAHPKIVLGYSDLTALLNTISQRSGIATFHGPVAAVSAFTPKVVEWLKRAIEVPEPMGILEFAGAQSITGPGKATGRLSGGNLTLLAALSGTPYEVQMDGVVFLEEVDEPPYRIDRLLTQLRLSGAFEPSVGILVGQCARCERSDDATATSLTLDETLRDRLAGSPSVVVTGAPIGHIDEQWTLPIGVHASLDGVTGTLTIEEPAVSHR